MIIYLPQLHNILCVTAGTVNLRQYTWWSKKKAT